ncbi:MAG: rhodanese-like domain-containing protein, partial [Planctomycetota bacterium]
GSLAEHEDQIETTNRITAVAASEMPGDPLIVDVRKEAEWNDGHIDGSLNVPLHRLVSRLDELPRDQAMIVHCQGGYRSAIAISVLQGAGFADTYDLVGGYKAWVGSGLPVIAPATATG